MLHPAYSTAEASEVQMAAWRALRPAERLEVALRLIDDGMALTVAGIRSRQPDLNDQGVITELHRILGNGELAR